MIKKYKDFERAFPLLFTDFLRTGEYPYQANICQVEEVNGPQPALCLYHEQQLVHGELLSDLFTKHCNGYTILELSQNLIGSAAIFQQQSAMKTADYRKQILDTVVFQLISKKGNEELLKTIFSDDIAGEMAMILRWTCDDDPIKQQRFLFKSEMRRYEITVEELSVAASRNTYESGVTAHQIDFCTFATQEIDKEKCFLICLNQKEYGACVFSNEIILKELAKDFQGSFYIEPFIMQGLLVHKYDPETAEYERKIKRLKEQILNQEESNHYTALVDSTYEYLPVESAMAKIR